MEDVRIILSATWVVLMLIYLFGDVMRLYAADITPGEIEGKPITQVLLMVMAIIMLPPIFMVFLSLTLPYSVDRLANIIVAIVYFLFNLISLRTYPGTYDKFLLIISLGINLLTVYYAWNWII